MKLFFYIFFITFFSTLVFLFLHEHKTKKIIKPVNSRRWEIQSIDTMKTSRDPAREKAHDASYDIQIDAQMEKIVKTGANYVAIDTPYDQEFIPFLTRWVKIARRNHLHVWFRGNFCGWEGWYDYPQIDQATHIEKTKEFILNHKALFEDEDIFTPCPECENAMKLQVSSSAQLKNYKEFLINEYNVSNNAFSQINKKVKAGYYSMNGDVAKAIMDKSTTKALGGVVVIDHYVKTPERLATDVEFLAKQSGGAIILGELGVPLADIHGEFNEEQQKEWINDALERLSHIPEVAGVNYWVNLGGSTALWNQDGTPRAVVSVINNYFSNSVQH